MQKTYGLGLVTEYAIKAMELPLMTKAQAQIALDKLKLMTQDSNPNIVVINRGAI